MAINTLFIDELLGCDVAGSEQHRRCNALREQRPGSQSGLVPGEGIIVLAFDVSYFMLLSMPWVVTLRPAQVWWGVLVIGIHR